MNKTKIIILLLISISGVLKSQILIKGRVLNSTTNKGVEYAIVQKEGTNIGCICDSDGNFIINNLKSIPDSLTFTCIGYDRNKIYKNKISSTDFINIKLNVKEIELNEVNVLSSNSFKNRDTTLGCNIINPHKGSFLYFASKNMRYFKSCKYPAIIKNFSFYIMDIKGARKARIRIYNLDTIQNIPGNDILINNLIVSNLKKGWNIIDLSKYKVYIPKQGFFIGLESIVMDQDCYAKNEANQWFSSRYDIAIASVKELTISAVKFSQIGGYEKYGEQKIGADVWKVSQGKANDLLYRVEIAY